MGPFGKKVQAGCDGDSLGRRLERHLDTKPGEHRTLAEQPPLPAAYLLSSET